MTAIKQTIKYLNDWGVECTVGPVEVVSVSPTDERLTRALDIFEASQDAFGRLRNAYYLGSPAEISHINLGEMIRLIAVLYNAIRDVSATRLPALPVEGGGK